MKKKKKLTRRELNQLKPSELLRRLKKDIKLFQLLQIPGEIWFELDNGPSLFYHRTLRIHTPIIVISEGLFQRNVIEVSYDKFIEENSDMTVEEREILDIELLEAIPCFDKRLIIT